MSEADDELHRQVEEYARRFHAAGHLVTWQFEVEAVTAAEFLNASRGTLRNWRSYGVGPPFRKHAGRVLYSIADLLEHRDRKRDRDGTVIDTVPVAGAESAPIAASTIERQSP
jgi:hypothetical protein